MKGHRLQIVTPLQILGNEPLLQIALLRHFQVVAVNHLIDLFDLQSPPRLLPPHSQQIPVLYPLEVVKMVLQIVFEFLVGPNFMEYLCQSLSIEFFTFKTAFLGRSQTHFERLD